MSTCIRSIEAPTRAVLLTVTPELAAAWLRNPERNRHTGVNLVRQYARDMSRGAWDCNGETIKFSGAIGTGLCDGKHRLEACVESGCSFDTFVVEHVRDWGEVDTGRKRSVPDALSIFANQFSNFGLAVDGATGLLLMYARQSKSRYNTGESRVQMTHRERVEFAKTNPTLAQAFAEAQPYMSLKSPLRASVTLALMFLAFVGAADLQLVHQFLRGVRDGSGLSEGDPALAYRNFLVNSLLARRTVTIRDAFRAGLNALVVYLAGDQLKQCKAVGMRSFPGAPPQELVAIFKLDPVETVQTTL